jgi:hypothetical protein
VLGLVFSHPHTNTSRRESRHLFIEPDLFDFAAFPKRTPDSTLFMIQVKSIFCPSYSSFNFTVSPYRTVNLLSYAHHC